MEEKKSPMSISEEEIAEKAHEAAMQSSIERLKELYNSGIIHLRNYIGVGRCKSIRRAIKRGHISIYGDVYPKRPFNNRKRNKGTQTYERKRIYTELKSRNKDSIN